MKDNERSVSCIDYLILKCLFDFEKKEKEELQEKIKRLSRENRKLKKQIKALKGGYYYE